MLLASALDVFTVLLNSARVRMSTRFFAGHFTVKERRRSPRVYLKGHVFLSLGGHHLDLPAADISVSGIGVLIDAAVLGAKPSGEVGVCRIDSPDLGGRVEAYVSVMRMRRLGERRLVGLRFESISDDELELIREYKRKCRETPAAS
jgi:hypothetical protein